MGPDIKFCNSDVSDVGTATLDTFFFLSYLTGTRCFMQVHHGPLSKQKLRLFRAAVEGSGG